jgi:hypothetical protein
VAFPEKITHDPPLVVTGEDMKDFFDAFRATFAHDSTERPNRGSEIRSTAFFSERLPHFLFQPGSF